MLFLHNSCSRHSTLSVGSSGSASSLGSSSDCCFGCHNDPETQTIQREKGTDFKFWYVPQGINQLNHIRMHSLLYFTLEIYYVTTDVGGEYDDVITRPHHNEGTNFASVSNTVNSL